MTAHDSHGTGNDRRIANGASIRFSVDPSMTTGARFEHWGDGSRTEVDGCEECNRTDAKPWPIFTVNYHGVEVCAKCLQPIDAPRRPRG